MLEYIANEPYVQVAFLALIAIIFVAAFINHRWTKVEKNDWKREVRRHEWGKEERERKNLVPTRSSSDLDGM